MDFTGLNRFTTYKLDRPLTDEERKGELDPKQPVNVEPLDWLSVIKLNSTYLDLVDRWYPIKGFAVWMGAMVVLPIVGMIAGLIWVSIVRNEIAAWAFLFVVSLFSLILLWGGVFYIRLDAFRQTHYPIRLNRKTRQVYAYRPNGTIIQASWDNLFICQLENKLTLWQTSHDIRAHVLAEDGETVKDTFTLGYPYLGDKKGLMQLWEYIRRYMEEPGGVEKNYKLTEICMPIDGRREGLAFGLVRTFAPFTKWPIAQLIASPIAALTVLGRWFAMYTSKVPRWPAEIEAGCQVDANDPYRKDWRNNGKYSFIEGTWPVICFLVGFAVVVCGVTALVRAF